MIIEKYNSLKVFHLDNGELELYAGPNVDFVKTAIPDAVLYIQEHNLEGVSLYDCFNVDVYVEKGVLVKDVIKLYEEMLYRYTGLTIS